MCQFLSWLLVQCYIFFKKYEIFSISDSPQWMPIVRVTMFNVLL
jgi:hypothetical protein